MRAELSKIELADKHLIIASTGGNDLALSLKINPGEVSFHVDEVIATLQLGTQSFEPAHGHLFFKNGDFDLGFDVQGFFGTKGEFTATGVMNTFYNATFEAEISVTNISVVEGFQALVGGFVATAERLEKDLKDAFDKAVTAYNDAVGNFDRKCDDLNGVLAERKANAYERNKQSYQAAINAVNAFKTRRSVGVLKTALENALGRFYKVIEYFVSSWFDEVQKLIGQITTKFNEKGPKETKYKDAKREHSILKKVLQVKEIRLKGQLKEITKAEANFKVIMKDGTSYNINYSYNPNLSGIDNALALLKQAVR